MRNFAEKIRGLISRSKKEGQPDQTPLDFVKSRKGILKELYISKQSGNLVGVYSSALGDGMFLLGVDNIEFNNKDESVVFREFDMSGHPLSRTRVKISEIKMICPFNKIYKSPVSKMDSRLKRDFV